MDETVQYDADPTELLPVLANRWRALVFLIDEPKAPCDLLDALDAVHEADRVRAFTPTLLATQIGAYHEAATSNGTELRLILSTEALGRSIRAHTDRLTELLVRRAATTYESDSLPAFSLQITEREDHQQVAIVVYSNGSIHGALTNDTAAAIRWAEKTYRALERTSKRLFGKRRSPFSGR